MYNHDKTLGRFEEFDKIVEAYKGDVLLLERAIGAYFVGRRLGWKILYVIHDTKTLRKYERILGVAFREEFEDFEDQAKKSRAYKALKLVSNFWKAIKGETPNFERSALMGR